jgi:large repetitive protein
VTATANGTAGAYTVTASASGATPNGTFTLANLAVPTITLSPTTLPNGVKGVAYPSQTLSATGGTAPYTFTLTAGSLPSGLTLSTAGVLSGTPTATGPFTFTVAATDNSAGHFTGTQQYMVTVSAAALVSIAVMPANGTLKVGQTQQYTATGTYQDGTTPVLPAVQVTWTSDTPGVASVNASGEVTATAGGTAHITATVGSVSGQTMVTVSTPTLGGVSVPPAPSGRPSGTTSAPGATPAPAPSAPPHGGTAGSGPAPGPLPTGR